MVAAVTSPPAVPALPPMLPKASVDTSARSTVPSVPLVLPNSVVFAAVIAPVVAENGSVLAAVRSEKMSISVPGTAARVASRCEMCNVIALVPNGVLAVAPVVCVPTPAGRALVCAKALVIHVAMSARVMAVAGLNDVTVLAWPGMPRW